MSTKPDDPDVPFDDNRPATEAEWEQWLRRSDVRSARFGELLETLRDHPQRDELVAREMGWTELANALSTPSDHPETDDDADDAEDLESFLPDEDVPPMDDEAVSDAMNERRRRLSEIPAFVICEKTSHAVQAILKPFEQDESKLDEETGELIGEAFIGIHIACAKISGGDAMGYDEDTLCGNIVNNKRALEGVQQSIEAFEQLRGRGSLPADVTEGILTKLRESAAAIEARITELRAMVWWD